MKCEDRGYCEGEEADHKCKNCAKLYCEECARYEEFICGCQMPPANILPMYSSKTSEAKK